MKIRLPIFSFFLVLFASLSVMGQSFQGGKEEMPFQYRQEPVKMVQIYPNPATEFVNIRFEAPIAKKVIINVHNVIGNVMEVETESVDEFEIRIKVKDLATGYYLLSVKEERINLNSTYKFLKR